MTHEILSMKFVLKYLQCRNQTRQIVEQGIRDSLTKQEFVDKALANDPGTYCWETF